MPTEREVETWAKAYREAWMGADSAAAAALFTHDATYRSNIFEEPHNGHAGIEEYWRGVTSVQSDVDVQMGSPFIDGSKVSLEFWTTMTVEGDPVTLAGCLLLDFDDAGLCTSLREYWNLIEGIHQPPADWGE